MRLHTDRRKTDDRDPIPATEVGPDPRRLDLARQQGDTYGAALELMATEVAIAGDTTVSGDYEVAYILEPDQGIWELRDDRLAWVEPDDGATLVEIVIRDAADGRFIPGLDVAVSIRTADGSDVGTHPHELAWHPMLYHYTGKWHLPGPDTYALRVQARPPTFHRHDHAGGDRFTEPIEAVFDDIEIR